MNEKYEIYHFQDNEYAIYFKGDIERGRLYQYRGNLEEINAWMSLKEKGFDI
jgi:hypothetical protein